MKLNKFVCLLLVLVMTALVCVGCGENDESSEPISRSDVSDNPYVDENGNYVPTTSGNFYDGKTVTFLTCGVNTVQESEVCYNTYEDGSEHSLLEVLNDDLLKRSQKLEEDLGIVVEEIYVFDGARKNGEFAKRVRQENMAPTEDFQVIVPCLYDGGTLAISGELLNLYDIDGLQIEAPWWNQEFNETLTYGGQLYFTIGDIGLINKNSTAALYFNYDLWAKFGLVEKFGGYPYDLVRDGKWTVDVVFEAAKVLGQDKNNDGKIDYSDEFGWGGQLDDMWSIFFASGAKIASADANGYPSLTMYSERTATLIEKLQDFVQDKEHYISANDYFGVAQWPTVLVQKAFTDGNALFYNASLGTIIELGVMEQHFGIVPVPKADEGQDEYYSLVNPWTSTCFAIPNSVMGDHLIMTADALNYLGAYSKNTLAADYEQLAITYMKTRDDESIEMINDYILPTRACDIGMIYQWGNLDIFLQELASSPKGTFASGYEAKADAAKEALSEAVEFFKDHE